MRHLKRTAKLGRQFEHRNAMLANLVCSLIKHKRVTTTLAKAKAARPVAEKMVTLGKAGSRAAEAADAAGDDREKSTLRAQSVHYRRLAAARLHARGPSGTLRKAEKRKWREQEDVVRILFDEVAPAFKERNGGYTRLVKLHERRGDAAQRAILEWVDYTAPAPAPAAATPAEESKPAEDKPESK